MRIIYLVFLMLPILAAAACAEDTGPRFKTGEEEIEKAWNDAVYLRCISEEEKFSSLNGLVTKRNIIF